MSLLTSAATNEEGNAYENIHRQSPLGGFEIFGGGWRNDALGFRHCFLQTPDRLAFVRFVLGMNPFAVFVARTDFANRTEMTFGRALEEGFKERGSDFHGVTYATAFGLRKPCPRILRVQQRFVRTKLSALRALRSLLLHSGTLQDQRIKPVWTRAAGPSDSAQQ